MFKSRMEYFPENPFLFGIIAAFGNTVLGALILRFLGKKFRPINVAQKYTLLVITGYSYGRFTGIEAFSKPLVAGTTAGAVIALAILWYMWGFRSWRTGGSTQQNGD